MGRKAVFSDQQIINAGKSIEEEGKLVSPFAIRNILNGGSTDRIKEVWNQYKDKQKEEDGDLAPEEKIELPTEIQEALDKNSKSAINHLERLAIESYKVAQNIAEKRVKSTIEDYQSKIAVLEESERQANLAIEASDNRADALEEELESISKENQNLLTENSRLNGTVDMLKEQIKKLELTESKYSELQREFGKLEGQIELLKKS